MSTDENLPSIRKIARVHYKATDTYRDIIEFTLPNGNRKTLELSPSTVADESALEKKLRDAGFVLQQGEIFQQIILGLADAIPPLTYVREAQTGWLPNLEGFVTTNGVIGAPGSTIIGVDRSGALVDRTGHQSIKGKWKAWRQTVADPARHSTSGILAICAAFGAPLLSIINRQSFTINLYGRTNAGKTIATVAAASVNGVARVQDLISWKITNARLEERLAEFSDAIFPINDFNSMKGGDREKYQRIRDLAYSIAEGNETARSAGYVGTTGGIYRAWTTIALTSSEIAISEMAFKSHQQRQQGETHRLIDVPATFDGLDHIFDLASDAAREWRSQTVDGIVNGIAQNHGKVFVKYIESLIAKRATLKQTILQEIDFFCSKACQKSDGGVAREAAWKLGVLYAGGVLGIQCRALPWTKKELLAALIKSFDGAKQLLPDTGILLRQGKVAFKELRLSLPHWKDGASVDLGHAKGFGQRVGDRLGYVIRWDAFTATFASLEQQQLVIDWLIAKQRAVAGKAKKAPGPSGKLRKQVRWPDGKRVWSIEVVFPKKEKAKK